MHNRPLREGYLLPCDQGVEVVEDGGVVVGCPAVGMGLDVALQVEQGDEPFAFACASRAALQLSLGCCESKVTIVSWAIRSTRPRMGNCRCRYPAWRAARCVLPTR